MSANQRQAREDSHLPEAGWSNWEQAMVPVFRSGVDEPRGPNQAGFMRSNIRIAFLIRADTEGFMSGELREHSHINPIMLSTLEAHAGPSQEH